MKKFFLWIAFLLALALLGLTLFNASWIAPDPEGRPKLIAALGSDCAPLGAAGYGDEVPPAPLRALQIAVGRGAAMIAVDAEGARLRIADAPITDCPAAGEETAEEEAEAALPVLPVEDPLAALQRGGLMIRVEGASEGALIGRALAAYDGPATVSVLGDGEALAALREAAPDVWAWSSAEARTCFSDYAATGWVGQMPACDGGTMLLALGDLWRLPGWPDRYLSRIEAAGIVPIVVAAIDADGDPVPLSRPEQYGEIAASYNGYIWVDDIVAMGGALRD